MAAAKSPSEKKVEKTLGKKAKDLIIHKASSQQVRAQSTMNFFLQGIINENKQSPNKNRSRANTSFDGSSLSSDDDDDTINEENEDDVFSSCDCQQHQDSLSDGSDLISIRDG